ncbi:MAG: CBS domain-containing protein [Candidatus Methanoperedenaceae archaeon]|nr:CBS domain-containing protein [Candidatus Methanoperedenaceae archaeon]MDW7727881.1 CBS domain-containing protein [Candidatus Methanoperedens sp.]
MEARLPVKDIMTRGVATIDIKSKVTEMAGKMLEFDIGSIIITDNNSPVGIVTERDMVKKIISKNLKPDKVSLKDLMTSPLITIPGSEDVNDAMQKMVKMQIRRLPVVENSKLAGIVTDIDLIAISAEMGNIFSDLIEMHRERLISMEVPQQILQGICEECGDLVDNLRFVNGKLLCENCRET